MIFEHLAATEQRIEQRNTKGMCFFFVLPIYSEETSTISWERNFSRVIFRVDLDWQGEKITVQIEKLQLNRIFAAGKAGGVSVRGNFPQFLNLTRLIIDFFCVHTAETWISWTSFCISHLISSSVSTLDSNFSSFAL